VLKNRPELPENSGVYLFKTKKNRVLYVGKAKNLNKRVQQYFKSTNRIISDLIKKSDKIDYILTTDESDALLLEFNLIHTHKPEFNIRLKDDKSYPGIEITINHEFPAIYFSRKPSNNSLFFGPITSASLARRTTEIILTLFKIRSCKDSEFNKKTICLYYHIEKCSAPCVNHIGKEEYIQNVNKAISFLKGEKKEIINELKTMMKNFSKNLEFEKAESIKKQINEIENLNIKNYFITQEKKDYDIIDYKILDDQAFFILITIEKGRIKRTEYFDIKTINEKENVLKEFLLNYYNKFNLPKEIYFSKFPMNKDIFEEFLRKISGKRIKIIIPKRGKKKEILEFAKINLNHFVLRNSHKEILKRIKETLKLKKIPYKIEAVDISHFQENKRVGAIVRFDNGKPYKKLYRNYKIKEAKKGDTEAIKEVLVRRWKNSKNLPDLMIIDGGKPQLNSAIEVKNKLKIEIEIVAIEKGEEKIFTEKGNVIKFNKYEEELFLFQSIRDEVHRRAITFYKKLRERI